MIEARALSRAFDDGGKPLKVLDGAELSVAQGDFVAITGRSGTGKSTLLNVLGGLDTAYQGEVAVAGQRLSGLGDAALSRFRNLTVGFVFQSFHLVAGWSALENVALPALFSGERDAAAPARAQAALERVGLGEKAQRAPHQLSGGERQRVAIARALFNSPKVLLCDEPTGNLDAATAAEVIALFSRLHREGLTLVVVTHEEKVSAAASRVLVLREGKLT